MCRRGRGLRDRFVVCSQDATDALRDASLNDRRKATNSVSSAGESKPSPSSDPVAMSTVGLLRSRLSWSDARAAVRAFLPMSPVITVGSHPIVVSCSAMAWTCSVH